MPDSAHHVLADPEFHQGILAPENVWMTCQPVHTLLQPCRAERKGLMAGEGAGSRRRGSKCRGNKCHGGRQSNETESDGTETLWERAKSSR